MVRWPICRRGLTPSGVVPSTTDEHRLRSLPWRPRSWQTSKVAGLSHLVILAMAACARAARLDRLVAPVRPSWKDRYPLTPIDQYAHWRRHDGLPFDPWMRVHARLGGTIVRPEPESLFIEAPDCDWEDWTGMAFPADGEYVFPAGLAPLRVQDGIGSYWEPNVWMLHEV